jgi:hypothetical protein
MGRAQKEGYQAIGGMPPDFRSGWTKKSVGWAQEKRKTAD